MTATERITSQAGAAARTMPPVSVEQFLSVFVRDHFIELRAIDLRTKAVECAFLAQDEIQQVHAFLKRHASRELYQGCAERLTKHDGRIQGCGNAYVLWCDIDFKDIPEAEARQRLKDFHLTPSILIHSGNGLHCYWLLNPAYKLQSDPARFKNLLRRIAFALRGDLKSADSAHVLRVIGTINHKYAHKPVVTAEHFELGDRYTVHDFESLPQEPEVKRKAARSKRTSDERRRPIVSLNREERIRRAAAYVATMDPAIQGQGGDHRTYCAGAVVARDFDLSVDDALTVLGHWNSRCVPPWTDQELEQKVRNALRYSNGPVGSKLEERPTQNSSCPEPKSEKDHIHDDRAADEGCAARPTRYSDDALADLLSTRRFRDLKFVDSWGWLQWDGLRWKRISDVVVMGYARQVCREQSELCKQDSEIASKARLGLARALASAKTVAAVVRLAATDKRHHADVTQFDARPWLFNTPSGTVDLKAGQVRAHLRNDLLTKISNATPRGDCPRWLEFLERVTGGNKELRQYLKRLAGYAMVGDPREECLDFFHGGGGNGKGTFLSTLQYAFGEYATTAGVETFVESKGDKHPCDLAKLTGVRLVVANEVDEGQHWDEARIKNLTGRDVITARFMRQDFFEFVPQFTLIIAGNHKPSLKTVDESIRRRLHLVPFTVTIPASEQDTRLKEELRAEADGILRWALEGCLEWQQERLNPPEVVLAATAAYLGAEDVFGMWLSDSCERRSDYEEPSAFVYESYRQWKESRGERPQGHKAFSTKLTDLGFELRRDSKTRSVSGLHLTDSECSKAKEAIKNRKGTGRKADAEGDA